MLQHWRFIAYIISAEQMSNVPGRSRKGRAQSSLWKCYIRAQKSTTALKEKKGGILTDTPSGTMSAIKNPLSASIRSPALKCFNIPEFSTIDLSDVEPGKSLLTYVITAFGATPIRVLKEFIPLLIYTTSAQSPARLGKGQFDCTFHANMTFKGKICPRVRGRAFNLRKTGEKDEKEVSHYQRENNLRSFEQSELERKGGFSLSKLDKILREISSITPGVGEAYVCGSLGSRGLTVQRWKAQKR
ncbi:hypothetical protein AC249_AIPGENE3709 [Exaiptasia diaphana]|nr:hypothetical protein AC249_AIPGENE3709 [Exaiptasia diaphana]